MSGTKTRTKVYGARNTGKEWMELISRMKFRKFDAAHFYGEFLRLRLMLEYFSSLVFVATVLLEFLGGRNQIIRFILSNFPFMNGASVVGQWVNWMMVRVFFFVSCSVLHRFLFDSHSWSAIKIDENWIFQTSSNWFSVYSHILHFRFDSFTRAGVFSRRIIDTNDSIDFDIFFSRRRRHSISVDGSTWVVRWHSSQN